MEHWVELNEKAIQAIIADYYHIPIEEIDKRVEINLSIITEGFGGNEHQEPFLYARVLKGG